MGTWLRIRLRNSDDLLLGDQIAQAALDNTSLHAIYSWGYARYERHYFAAYLGLELFCEGDTLSSRMFRICRMVDGEEWT